jgi:hypothetical protein
MCSENIKKHRLERMEFMIQMVFVNGVYRIEMGGKQNVCETKISKNFICLIIQ